MSKRISFVGGNYGEILRFKQRRRRLWEKIRKNQARNAIAAHVDDEDKKGAPIQGGPGGTQTMIIINESGLYALIFGSKLESAKRFKHWVTSEVLPLIRKTGAYGNIEQLQGERLLKFMDEQSKTSRFQQELIMEVTERIERLEKSKVDQSRESELLIPVRSMTFKDRMKKLNEVVSSLAEFYDVERKTALHKFYDGLNAELDVNLNTFLTAYRVETGNEDSCSLHAVAYYERIFSKAMALSFDTLRLDRIFSNKMRDN